MYEQKEPVECIQLDFWGAIKYLNESDKDILVAVDRLSRWPSALICSEKKSDKVLKFISSYINTHGVPRKIYINQGFNFTSKSVKTFCYTVGIKIIFSPVDDHRATGCVERTIGRILFCPM